MAFADYFSVEVFYLVFRETIESAVIVSVLLSFLRTGFGDVKNMTLKTRQTYNSLFWQVWLGAALGIVVCILIGAAFMVVFYALGANLWNSTEKLWEAFFCILASVLITAMGLKFLRMNNLQAKWKSKLSGMILERGYVACEEAPKSLRTQWKFYTQKYSLAVLPFVTTLREGLEAVMFLGGLGARQPGSSFPLAVLTALILGSFVGVLMYKWGSHTSIRVFLISSTCFLYLVAAGLFSRGVWFYEMHQFVSRVGQDVSESGSGPGSYNIRRTIWHVNCCNPETDGGWMIFNALLGWQNTATYGSVLSYNMYWLFVMFMILYLKFREKRYKRVNADELISRAAAALATSDGRDNSIDSTTPLVA